MSFRRRPLLAWSAIAIIYVFGVTLRIKPRESRNLRTTVADAVNIYTQDDIMKTSINFQKFIPRLLVFDGVGFQAFGLAHYSVEYYETMRYTYRYIDTIPLLVQALKANFPDRFKPGMPPFELLFSDADSPHSECVNQKCSTETFAPMIVFGSSLKDDSIFPTLRSFPHPIFIHCLFEYKVNGAETCDWPQKPRKDIPWEALKDTIIWRGADYPFLYHHKQYRFEGPSELMERSESPTWQSGDRNAILDDLLSNMMDSFSPRWRAAIMSARTLGDATPWIDSKFVTGTNPAIKEMLSKYGIEITGERIDPDAMSNYKYQIDFGGGGGTSWEGTLTKLLMPGVLFHHETDTKDWFYDLMIPWKHYVPIKWDLSDLWYSFSSAQKHGEQMKQISVEGTRLGEYILSADYMEAVYQELFVTYLGKLVHAYQPPTDRSRWNAMKAKYLEKGFDLYKIADCKEKVCTMECRKGLKEKMMFINAEKLTGAKAVVTPPPVQEQMRYLLPEEDKGSPLPLEPQNWNNRVPQQTLFLPSQQQFPSRETSPAALTDRRSQADVPLNQYVVPGSQVNPRIVKKEVVSHEGVERLGTGEVPTSAFAYKPVLATSGATDRDRSLEYFASASQMERGDASQYFANYDSTMARDKSTVESASTALNEHIGYSKGGANYASNSGQSRAPIGVAPFSSNDLDAPQQQSNFVSPSDRLAAYLV